MTNAFILSIGNELLSGLTVDTNAAWISGQLAEMGIPTRGILMVPDEIPAIVDSLRLAVSKSDVVIMTGGLGPTDDDLTRQSIAEYLGVNIILHPESLEAIESFFRRRQITMVEKNRIQAFVPAGSQAIPNPTGTAPGIFVEPPGTMIFSLPGVPSEMKPMFTEFIRPRLVPRTGNSVIVSRRLKCFGAGESVIAEKLGDLMLRGRNPLINCTVADAIITLHIIAHAVNRPSAETLIRRDHTTLCEILGDLVYGNDDQTLAEVVGSNLARKHKTIAIAESCTGGLIAKMFTDVPGSSRYFTHGWVTYSNRAKESDLGVPAELLTQYGAVSEPVVRSMAQGALSRSGADIVVAVTGIAGPDGGSEQKPVGLVYICVGNRDRLVVQSNIFAHSRAMIRNRAALTAINLVRSQMNI